MASSTTDRSHSSCTSPQGETSSSATTFADAERLESMHTVQESTVTATECQGTSEMAEARLQLSMPHPDNQPVQLNSSCDVARDRNTCTPDNNSQSAENEQVENSTTNVKPVELNAGHSSLPNSSEASDQRTEFQNTKLARFAVSAHSSRTFEEFGVCEQKENVVDCAAESRCEAQNQIVEQSDKSQDGDKLNETANSENSEDNTQGSANSVPEDGDVKEGDEAAAAVIGDEHSNHIEDANGEQHSLTGPHRRHHMARRQRIREANAVVPPPPPSRRTISIPQALRAQWRAIGAQWGLEDDNAIANVLLRHYEDLMAGRPPRPPPRPRCQDCGEALVPAPCLNCGPNHHSNRLAHSRHDNNPGTGRGNFCGRCRD